MVGGGQEAPEGPVREDEGRKQGERVGEAWVWGAGRRGSTFSAGHRPRTPGLSVRSSLCPLPLGLWALLYAGFGLHWVIS